MDDRKRVTDFSSGALIKMGREAATNGNMGLDTFKEVNNVSFSFLELCLSLYKRKMNKRRILCSDEFTRIKAGAKKSEIVEIFDEVDKRFEELVFQQRDEKFY